MGHFPERIGALRDRTKAKVIAFANQKGGVAKTTTTLNLAVAFAEKGHRVLCVRHGPAGQPDDVAGHRPRHASRSRCTTCSSTTSRSAR